MEQKTLKNNKSRFTDSELTLKFLKYLYEGQHIKIEGVTYCITNTGELGVVCLDENGNELDRAFEIKDLSLRYITSLAKKISDDEYFILGAGHVLNNLERK